MDAYITILILFILSLIGVIFLGLIAGFSPTLYIAQTALSTKKSNAKRYTYSLMAGVLLAAIILLLTFQIINLTTLIAIFESALEALFLSVAFNILVGLLFILAGFRYIYSRNAKQAYDADTNAIKNAGGASAFFGFGFAKTFLSVSGATAIYVGGNIIASTGNDPVIRLLFTLAFLVACVIPFWCILYLIRRVPDKVEQLVHRIKVHIETFNYRLTVGVAAILFGAAVMVINGMLALFY